MKGISGFYMKNPQYNSSFISIAKTSSMDIWKLKEKYCCYLCIASRASFCIKFHLYKIEMIFFIVHCEPFCISINDRFNNNNVQC